MEEREWESRANQYLAAGDMQTAFDICQAEADKGEGDARAYCGTIYLAGFQKIGNAINYPAAIACFRTAVDQGNAIGELMLGGLYLEGNGIEKNIIEALSLLKSAVDHGSAEAGYVLGTVYGYATPPVVTVDYEESARWFQRAVELGHPRAAIRLEKIREAIKISNEDAEWYTMTKKFVEENNPEEAMRWCLPAAEAGDANAQTWCGSIYYEGYEAIGDDINYKEAFRWYKTAADQGNATAQFVVGSFYDAGQGVDENHDEAISWYRKAASQGHEEAMKTLKTLNL